MNGMWFLLGVLCGVAVGACLPKSKYAADVKPMDGTVRTPSKEWDETRNFLYYDGTEMPVVKEDINE